MTTRELVYAIAKSVSDSIHTPIVLDVLGDAIDLLDNELETMKGEWAQDILDRARELSRKDSPEAMEEIPVHRWWWQWGQNLESMLARIAIQRPVDRIPNDGL